MTIREKESDGDDSLGLPVQRIFRISFCLLWGQNLNARKGERINKKRDLINKINLC
jgi:hypothetical protein